LNPYTNIIIIISAYIPRYIPATSNSKYRRNFLIKLL